MNNQVTISKTENAHACYRSASEARKNGDFAKAVEIYSTLRASDPPLFYSSAWNLWGLGFSLCKLEHYQEALAVCRELYSKFNKFTPGRELYARCIYGSAFSSKNPVASLDAQKKAATAILTIMPQVDARQDANSFCWASLAVLRLVASLSKEQNAASLAPVIAEWTERLNPALLSSTPFTHIRPDGKKTASASPLEQWYASRARALYNAERHEECRTLCSEALAELEGRFHNDNDIWLSRLNARAGAAMGDKAGALAIYSDILRRKDAWFLRHERAVILHETGELTAALGEACAAALAPGPCELKVKLFALIADLLLESGREADASKHARLVRDIYRSQGWPMARLMSLLQRHNASVLKPDEHEAPDIKTCHKLAKALGKEIWSAARFAGQRQYKGTIRSILPSGEAGFIAAEDRRSSYYFRIRDFKGSKAACAPGAKVTFYLEDGFDRKRNRPVQNATQVALVEEIDHEKV